MSDLANQLRRSIELRDSTSISNVSDVEQRLIQIAAAARRGDISTALREEAMLHKQVLAAIATRSVNSPSTLALAALRTTELAFDRGD